MTTRKKTADNDTTSVDSSSPLPDEELLGLRRLLLRAKGFALAFVRSNVPAESQRIAGELVTSLALDKVPIRELRLNEKVEDLYAEASTLDPALESGEALVVIGFERSIPSGVDFPTALKRLNLQRERFRELPCALVLILPDYALDLLARKAPDFWAWRSGVFETQPIAQRLDQTVLNSSLPAFIGLSALSIERKNAHLAVLRSTLADLDRQGPGTETDRSELSVRIAVILQAIGEPQEALAHAQAALDLAGKDLRTRAYALDQIADILYARGDLDEAMRIRQDEQILVYEKLGDVRELLIARAKLAMTLIGRGQAGDSEKASNLLAQALADAKRLQLPEAAQIRDLIKAHGLEADERD